MRGQQGGMAGWDGPGSSGKAPLRALLGRQGELLKGLEQGRKTISMVCQEGKSGNTERTEEGPRTRQGGKLEDKCRCGSKGRSMADERDARTSQRIVWPRGTVRQEPKQE